MTSTSKPKAARVKVREHRERLRSPEFGPSRFGCRMYARLPCGRRHTASRWPLQRAPTPARIRHSSTRCRTGAMNEAWRHLDCRRRRQGLRGQATQPRAAIVQDDSFDAADAITICPFTTDKTEAPLFRLPVEPNDRNGLRATCHLMVDKITTVPKTRVGSRVGRLDDEESVLPNSIGLCSCFLDWRCGREPSKRHERQLGATAWI